MIKVKICGITNLDDALTVVDAGGDALGFVFYKNSPRYIGPQKAQSLIRNLPKKIRKVGVFVNAKEKEIRQIVKICRLDMLQFHGNESPEFCQKFHDYKVVKAFRTKDRVNLKDILKYRTFAYLFDSFAKSKFGGTGKNFNWGLLSNIENLKRPIFLSGGLNDKNVKAAIQILHPDWVDVSSSVEIKPGKKNRKKVQEFIEAVRKAVK